MVRIKPQNLAQARIEHVAAIKDYMSRRPKAVIDQLYNDVRALPGYEALPAVRPVDDELYWVSDFLLSDITVLRGWVQNHKEKLGFTFFKTIYLNNFSKAPDIYVDSAKTYNAYRFVELLGVKVCPYCEDHFLLHTIMVGGERRRNVEVDHFFPKGADEYPALAMCFYNLVPACKDCNQLRKTLPVAASPHDDDIESLSTFVTNLPVGVNMDTVDSDDCIPQIIARGNMKVNVDNLGLADRYAALTAETYHLLRNQQLCMEHLHDIATLGFNSEDELRQRFLGNPRSVANGKELHTKMKEDLTGY